MSIDRLPSGKHRVRVYVGKNAAGSPKYKTQTFTRLKDAREFERTMQVAKETGRVDAVDAAKQTLAELAAEHMKAVRPDLAEATFTTYRNLWRAHVHSTDLASMQLRSITPKAVEEWLADRRAIGAGDQSLRKTMALMQTILGRAVLHGIIPSNSVAAVKKPSGARRGSVRTISPREVEAIRAQLKGADRVFVAVLAYAGLRPEELRALRWGDLGTRTIRVERAATASGIGPTKTGKLRTVRLLAPLAADLTDWRTVSGNPPDKALIFPRADGGHWTEADYRNWRKRKFHKAVDAAGVDIARPYDLRHSAASLWLREGTDAVQVAKWMGHRPSMTLDTYAHVIDDLDPDDRTDAVALIEAARRDMPVTYARV